MKKAVKMFGIFGIVFMLTGFGILILQTILKDQVLYESEGVQIVALRPLTPIMPYVAGFSLVLSIVCLAFCFYYASKKEEK